ncbi:Hypothetical predicted protein, partial [Paramuricea clavata]
MEGKSNAMYDQMNTAATAPPYPTYGTDTNSAYPPVSTGYPPVASAYPPLESAYPPTTNAYPPPMNAYPPPMAAPPPYSASVPYETQTTNTTIVAITTDSYQPYTPEVGFDSKTVRL